MEKTIEETLQLGITAHKEGKFKDAERLYRTILQSLPLHADANHNLGVLAASAKNLNDALPLYKNALDANPKKEQFWLSYIDALIKKKQFSDVKNVIEQAKKKGITSEKLNILKAQLASVIEAEHNSAISPPRDQLTSLLNHYQAGRLGDAEKLAISITREFPKHQFGWKVLGAVFQKTGRIRQSLVPGKKSVLLGPQDAAAHNNLANTLKELGSLAYAEASYNQAIALKPDYAEAISNLGNMYKQLGDLGKAEASYNRAIALKPEFFEAYSNLGVTLQALGRLEEAEANYKQAIALKPDYVEARSNLGSTLQELGRLDEAEAVYKQALAIKPDFAIARNNLGVLFFESRDYHLAAEQFELCNTPQSKRYAIQCSYLVDEESVFYEKFDLLVSQDESNAVLGSLAFRSEFKYGIKKSNPFCTNPLSYVVKTDLNALCDFKNIFIETAKAVLKDNSVSYKSQGHLTNGLQTAGNIFSQGKVLKTEIESIIHAEIEKYRIQFENSEEGFVKSWPTSYEIKGWLVCMQSGGRLSPHMHDNGWITGSIYINVPPKSETDSGNLVLCLSDQDHALGAEQSHQSIIDVMTGSLCLFPSSLHHYTIPFKENEDRIVLAFDVIPK